MRPRSLDRLTLASFAFIVLIGGSNFVAVRFSNAELPPLWGATLRFGPAAVLLFAALAVLRIRVPHGAALTGAVIYGALNFGAGYALAYFGLQRATAGTAAVILATVPLFTLVLAVAHGLERLSARRDRRRDRDGGRRPRVRRPDDRGRAAGLPPRDPRQCRHRGGGRGRVTRFPRSHPLGTNAVGMIVGALMPGTPGPAPAPRSP